jgi:hypothetical protein
MNFKDSQIGKSMNEMLTGPMSWTQEDADKYLQTALSSGDPEGALEQLNVLLWSDKARDAAAQIAALGDAADRAAIALGVIGEPGSTGPGLIVKNTLNTDWWDESNPGHPVSRAPASTSTWPGHGSGP